MIEKYRDGVVPRLARNDSYAEDARDIADYVDAMNEQLLHRGLEVVFRNVDAANEYVTLRAPWKLARDPASAAALDETLATLARKLAIETVLLAPFMPVKAQAVWEQLGGPGAVAEQRLATLQQLDPSGWTVTKGAPLFPREAAAAA